jgi:2-amino-4-hydroxy-6-hydroxymethyldihydropteridine diphosphokinase
MATVYLGLGSNIERERYLVAGLDALQRLFGELALSSVYDSVAIGFDGQPFLNMAARVTTDLSVGELHRTLRHIEFEHGRPANATRNSARQLDIDILTYDTLVGIIEGVELPRGEILENAFVLCPLAELAPEASQGLVLTDFQWRGRAISRA